MARIPTDLMRDLLGQGSGVEVISLNKQGTGGSHNHREVEAVGEAGCQMWAGGGPALILWTEGSSHSGVNGGTSAICATEAVWPAWWSDPRGAAKPDVPADAGFCSHPICLSVIGKTGERLGNALRAAGGHEQCTDLRLSLLQCEMSAREPSPNAALTSRYFIKIQYYAKFHALTLNKDRLNFNTLNFNR